jgi:hypothetical protein
MPVRINKNIIDNKKLNLFTLFIGSALLLLATIKFLKSVNTESIDTNEEVNIIVPTEDIKVGSILANSSFKTIKYIHTGSESYKYITDIRPYLGSKVNQNLLAGKPIPISSVIKSYSNTNFDDKSGSIPEGMREMTIPLEGYIESDIDSRSDIVLTTREGSTIIAQDVNIKPIKNNSSNISNFNYVVITASQRECLAIQAALSQGRLSVLRRGETDTIATYNNHFSATDLVNSAKASNQPLGGFASVTSNDGSKTTYALRDGRWTMIHGHNISVGKITDENSFTFSN